MSLHQFTQFEYGDWLLVSTVTPPMAWIDHMPNQVKW